MRFSCVWFVVTAALLMVPAAAAAEPPEQDKQAVEQVKETEERTGEKWVGIAQDERCVEDITVGELMGIFEEEVRQVLSGQQAAWNRGDIDAFMSGYWKSDDLRFASGGTVTKGWQATLDRYKKRYDSREKMGRLSFSDLDVNVLSPNSALVFGRWKLEREGDTPSGLFTLLFRKIEDNWVIVHDHTSSE